MSDGDSYDRKLKQRIMDETPVMELINHFSGSDRQFAESVLDKVVSVWSPVLHAVEQLKDHPAGYRELMRLLEQKLQGGKED